MLHEFAELRSSIFSNNLAKYAIVTASSTRGDTDSRFGASRVLEESIYTYWAPAYDQVCWILYMDLKEILPFNVLQLQEPIHLGQRIISFHVDIMKGNREWHKILDGSTIGYKRLLQFPRVESQYLRFVIEKSHGVPLISFVGVHILTLTSLSNRTKKLPSNGTKFLNKFKDILYSIPNQNMSLRSQI